MIDATKISLILRLIAAFLLFWALGNHPYSYFQILRWLVSCTAFYTAWVFHERKFRSWVWLFCTIGILFNPVAPIYLSRETWQPLDVITAVVFIISLAKGRSTK